MDIEQSLNQPVLQKKIQNYLFNLNDRIGFGSFSQVFKGINLNNNITVAIKKIRITDMKSKIAKRLLDCQINILKNIHHPNIIQCQDVFHSVNNCYIVTSYCNGGNLQQKVKKSKKIHEQELKKIIYSIYKALQYLSSLNIIHRDIKLANILIHNNQYKIGDFGFAIKAKDLFRDIAIGSPIYMSPQGLINNIYGPKTDVWAFGLLIYQLIHGTTPLQNCKNEEQLKAKVLMPPKISSKIPSDLKQLIQNCLRINCNQRISIQQIGKSSYMKNLQKQFGNVFKNDLTETKDTISSHTSLSNNQNRVSMMSEQVSISLLSYCKLLHTLNQYEETQCFKKCISSIASLVNKQNRQYNNNKLIYQNIQNNIKFFMKQYGLSLNPKFDFRQVLQQSLKKQEKIYKQLFLQTQNLIRAFKLGNLNLYAKDTMIKSQIKPNVQ